MLPLLMVASVRQHFSFAEYLDLEEIAAVKHETEEYDRGETLAHYQRIPSLAEVVLVAHDERRLEIWRREGDHWTLDVFRAGDRARLASLGSAIAVDEVYRDPLAA